jgi:hypothetical protein
MVNVLNQGDSELVPLDYSDLLQKISQQLNNQTVFQLSGSDRLIIDIDTIANQVANLQVQNPLTSPNGVRSATINFTPGFHEKFSKQIREIRDILQQMLESVLGKNQSIAELINSLVTPLQNFQGNPDTLGFKYKFNQPSLNLQKRKLSVSSDRPGSASLLKFHKLKITVREIDRFPEYLQQGLENHIDDLVTFDSEADRKELQDTILDQIEEPSSDFNRLKRIVDTETLGKLKKEAKIRYLEYLRDHVNKQDQKGFIYLRDLIRRLRLIEDFINQEKPDDYYDVNYAGVRINYQDILARSQVLDSLPIIPLVTGNLGETTDTNAGERQFVFGLKMKFGNPVQALDGKEVFDYNLNLLNPDSEEHQQELKNNPNFGEKVLKLTLLYFFIFASRSNPEAPDYNPNSELEYDPIDNFDSKVMTVLRGSDEPAKQRLFRGIVTGLTQYNTKLKIKVLRDFLQNALKQQTILPTRTYPIQISVRRGILVNNKNQILNGIFFKEVVRRNYKECLKYISIGEAQIGENAVCQIPANITIEDIRYFSTEERQEFAIEYDIRGINTLPVMWVPESCLQVCEKNFIQKNYKFLLFIYNNKRLNPQNFNSTQNFIYQFTISLLAYICLKILLDAANQRLFIPMLRLHEGDHKNPLPSEKFIAHLSKTLCHLLNEKHRCNSQGFRVQNPSSFKIKNGLSSLYSVLPRKFRFTNPADTPTLDKLAIIVVSSLESDARKGNRNRENRISNLVGEAIGITYQKADNSIRLYIIKTFSENYSNRRLYRDPPILIDTVNNLYQQGYRDFLYVAQTPFTSNLNITQTEDDDRLYFMSPALIKDLKGNHDDIKIYPVFFDKYYVRRSKDLKAASLYIQDTNQLLNVAADSAQQAVVFFNLFNGISVGSGDDRFYNGVISYSTLLSVYPGILDDQYIRHLINDESPVKNDILQYLTLFHFSRFEKTSDISLKLDPYENIIGEESFNNLSVFHHIRGEVDFNSLAFLTEVRKVLNV